MREKIFTLLGDPIYFPSTPVTQIARFLILLLPFVVANVIWRRRQKNGLWYFFLAAWCSAFIHFGVDPFKIEREPLSSYADSGYYIGYLHRQVPYFWLDKDGDIFGESVQSFELFLSAQHNAYYYDTDKCLVYLKYFKSSGIAVPVFDLDVKYYSGFFVADFLTAAVLFVPLLTMIAFFRRRIGEMQSLWRCFALSLAFGVWVLSFCLLIMSLLVELLIVPAYPNRQAFGVLGRDGPLLNMNDFNRWTHDSDMVFFTRITNNLNRHATHYYYRNTPNISFPDDWLAYTAYSVGLFDYNYPVFHDYRRFLRKGFGLCGDFAMAARRVLLENGYSAEAIGLDGHIVARVFGDAGKEFIIDPDYNLVIPHSRAELAAKPELTASYYRQVSGLDPKVVDLIVFIYAKDTIIDYRPWDATQTTNFAKWMVPAGIFVFGLGLMIRSACLVIAASASNMATSMTSRIKTSRLVSEALLPKNSRRRRYAGRLLDSLRVQRPKEDASEKKHGSSAALRTSAVEENAIDMLGAESFLAITRGAGFPLALGARILDFGCGTGGVVCALLEQGYDAYGFDVVNNLGERGLKCVERFAGPENCEGHESKGTKIDWERFTLPYPDDSFDAVFTSQVFEHVMDHEPVIREFARVMKKNAVSLNRFPPRYYPIEQHVRVPLAHLIHSKPYYYAMALFGCEHGGQRGMGIREKAENNYEYIGHGVHYATNKELLRLGKKYFHYAVLDQDALYCRTGTKKWYRRWYFENFKTNICLVLAKKR